jgi:hypothetical protein
MRFILFLSPFYRIFITVGVHTYGGLFESYLAEVIIPINSIKLITWEHPCKSI